MASTKQNHGFYRETGSKKLIFVYGFSINIG